MRPPPAACPAAGAPTETVAPRVRLARLRRTRWDVANPVRTGTAAPPVRKGAPTAARRSTEPAPTRHAAPGCWRWSSWPPSVGAHAVSAGIENRAPLDAAVPFVALVAPVA